MGPLKKFREMTGRVSNELLSNGLIGRAQITNVEQTGTSAGTDMDPHPVCVFTLDVMLDNQAPLQASRRQFVPFAVCRCSPAAARSSRSASTPGLDRGGSRARRRAADRHGLRGSANTASAADILARGQAAR
jgi:hypothetical protein